MTSKHTPGPWHVRTFDGSQWSIDAPGDLSVAQAHQIRPLTFDLTQDERSANARLIAAAPELLEACQTFAEWLRREEGGFPAETRFNTPEGEAKWREWFDENLRICDLAQTQARAAIAKATGEPK